MKKIFTELSTGNLIMKLIQPKDTDNYYNVGFKNPDALVNYYTATTTIFSKALISDYIHRIYEDENRYDFLIYNTDQHLLGEIVLNEIDWNARIAGFRIALFRSEMCNSGIGKRCIKKLLVFAFETLKLHRIELEVFDYNERAKHVYETCGFQVEGRKRDALYINQEYHDIFIMSILNRAKMK